MPNTKSRTKKKRSRSKTGKLSRTKGRSFEQEIARDCRPIWPEAKRGIGQARSGGEVCDVEGTPFWMECKHHKRVNIQAAMRQALEARKQGKGYLRPPLIVSKDNGGQKLATMSFEIFLALCRLLPQFEVTDDPAGVKEWLEKANDGGEKSPDGGEKDPVSTPLAHEINHLNTHWKDYQQKYLNKFVVIKEDDMLGHFDTFERAYKHGVELLGNVPMLIKQVTEDTQPW